MAPADRQRNQQNVVQNVVRKVSSDRKTPITAADFLNDRVIPFFDSHEVKLLRMLTDRGSEYCGNPERHEYELYLDFPPAPKVDIYGKLDLAEATPAELRGQEIFFGKGQCAACHTPPYYTDNLWTPPAQGDLFGVGGVECTNLSGLLLERSCPWP